MSKMKETTWVKLGSPNVWGVYLCVCGGGRGGGGGVRVCVCLHEV